MRRMSNSGEKYWHRWWALRRYSNFFVYGNILHITNENINRAFEIKWEDESLKESACPLFCGEIWQLSTLGNHASGNYAHTYNFDLFNSKSTLYNFLSFHRAFCRLFNYTHQHIHIYIYIHIYYLITHTNTCTYTYILFKTYKIYIKIFKTLLHVSITRSSSGSIYCSLLKL